MLKGYWHKGIVHTRCKTAEEAGLPATLSLFALNMLWWADRVCLECMPDPVRPEPYKSIWPFRWPQETEKEFKERLDKAQAA